MALARFGFGRGGGVFLPLVVLAIIGVLIWALTKPTPIEKAKE